MPRPRKPELDGKEVKKRSRNGCWPCKSRKVKCGEEKPACLNCQRQSETCDYSIRLNWDGRTKKKDDDKPGPQMISFAPSPSIPPASSPNTNGHTPGSQFSSGATPVQQMAQMTQQIHGANGSMLQESPLPPITSFGNHMPMNAPDFQSDILPTPPILRNPSWEESTRHGSISGPTPMIGPRGSISMPSYPSPSNSGFGSPGLAGPYNSNGYSSSMPPPMTSNPLNYQDIASSPYNGAKRVRLSPQTDVFGSNSSYVPRGGSISYGQSGIDDMSRAQYDSQAPTFFQPVLSNPLTPAPSSTSISQNEEDRRISVSSLLSDDPTEPPSSKRPSGSDATPTAIDPQVVELPRRGSLHQRMISYSETETYGHDRGQPDFDVPRNNDTMAISGMSPSEHSDFGSWLDAEFEDPGFGFGTGLREAVFAKGGYYASPVSIKIPRKLEPLPKPLAENPMNLLYFHHFLNHTARILVPHDCPENPFKTILPQMAVQNPNLLNLMLAYSACHRARLLGHQEPHKRIAGWTEDVFSDFSNTLGHIQDTQVSNANLATAIMLTSLEIISPSSFGVAIPWQNHLSIARSIIRSRGGPHSVSRKDPVMYFLTRWLAYLDVLGSLSGRRNEEPLYAGDYWSSSHDGESSAQELSLTDDDSDDEDDYTIDCLLGFTTRCVSILAQIALLARECETHRLNPETGQIDESWRPSPDLSKRADKLRRDLEHAREHEQKQCAHHSPEMKKAKLAIQPERRYSYANMTDKDAEESLATNSAFHWAGLVHLLRRVHNLPRSHHEVQHAVHEIVKVITSLREGGSAEACLLFPMFTAGVEAENSLDRAEVLTRIKGAEGLGMCQVTRARKVMETVWRTGESWECLGQGDFFG